MEDIEEPEGEFIIGQALAAVMKAADQLGYDVEKLSDKAVTIVLDNSTFLDDQRMKAFACDIIRVTAKDA